MDAPENALEAALRKAAGEPAHRPAFYKTLLDATVFILGHSEGSAQGNHTMAAGEKVSIQNWQRADGSPVIPFFSSLDALQSAIAEETNYIALPARSLFEITKGASLVLNPKSSYGKEFLPQEVAAMLVGEVNRIERRVTTEPTNVLLAQPATFPTKMVDSLSKLFATMPNVNAAYLTLMHDPSHDEKPALVVGIDADGDFEAVVRAAGAVAADTVPDGAPVDLTRVVAGQDGLSAHFLSVSKPFYERKLGDKLKSMLGFGNA